MWVFKKIDAILKKEGLDISTPIKDIPEDILEKIVYGKKISVAVESSKYPGTMWHTNYDGVVGFINKTIKFRARDNTTFYHDCEMNLFILISEDSDFFFISYGVFFFFKIFNSRKLV